MSRARPIALLGLLTVVTAACTHSFEQIDTRVNDLLVEGTSHIGSDHPPRPATNWAEVRATDDQLYDKSPETWNPDVDEMTWNAMTTQEIQDVLMRLEGYRDDAAGGTVLSLPVVLEWAFRHGREYVYAEEEYLLACLRLMLEQHLWTPQLSDDIALQYEHTDGDNDFLESARAVVNTFSATQRLPWGGEVTASYVATFAHDVLGAASTTGSGTEKTQTGQFYIGGSIPLLRNSGMIAQEDIIQAERSLIYAARSFEDFRRDYWSRIVSAWLALLVQKKELDNAIETLDLFDKLAERRRALYEAGRAKLYDAAESENEALQAQSRVAGLWEGYRLAVDRFKVLINWPVDDPVLIDGIALAIDPPATDLMAAVETAMTQRLDLQTMRDRLVDDQRAVRNALNQLLPDLDLAGEVRFGSNNIYYYDTTLPSLEDLNSVASLTFGLPLDREAERLAVRSTQVVLERARRQYGEDRDSIAINVRAAVRDIDASLFSLDIQRRNVQIARLNIESINADPDAYTVIEQTSAIRSLQSAQNGRAQAFRRVQESIIQYLTQTGQLRISGEAWIELIPGMSLSMTEDLSYDDPTDTARRAPETGADVAM